MAGFWTNGVPEPSSDDETLPLAATPLIPADVPLADGAPPQSMALTPQQIVAAAAMDGAAAITYGASVTLNASTSNLFSMTFGAGNCALTLENLQEGQILRFRLTQDGVGSRTLTPAATGYTLLTSGTPLSTGAGAIDLVEIQVIGTILHYYPVAKNFV